MTHPTKAIAPILLEDFRRITVNREGDTNFFTSEMIKTCMKKSIAVNLHQRVQVHVLLVTNPLRQNNAIRYILQTLQKITFVMGDVYYCGPPN